MRAADIYAHNIVMNQGTFQFDVISQDWTLNDVKLNMGGMHNVENVIAAIVVAQHLKIDSDKIRSAIQNFKGVKRRFEYVIAPTLSDNGRDEIVFIDDYAHHPEELKALITSAKTLFSDRRCTVVFQPHLFTRTRDFADEFAQILDMANEVILLPIYPARELPIEGVTSDLILNKMKNKNKSLKTKDRVIKLFK
ncbi:MAG: cyanophycin synthetase [Chitinophagaceae bacterium]